MHRFSVFAVSGSLFYDAYSITRLYWFKRWDGCRVT